MKLRVVKMEETPANCTRRVVLYHDRGYEGWVRNDCDNTFLLWSACDRHQGDRRYDRDLKKWVDVESPFEPVVDEDGCGTGFVKRRDGLIVFPVDVYEHSGTVWFLRGEAPVGCSCPWDSTCSNEMAPFYLYVDQDRWERFCGNCAWTMENGKPSRELLEKARAVARSEIEDMNLCEQGSYYGFRTEELVTEEGDVTVRNECDGVSRTEHRRSSDWNETDSCGGFLTSHPAQDVDFEIGCPVVTEDEYLVGDIFSQECWAFSDDMTGKFVRFGNGGARFVDDPYVASLRGSREALECVRKSYEEDLKKALTVVDVTERVWNRFPMCKA